MSIERQSDPKPTISVIVPVYQVAPYLRECLDSILEQSFADWEMLLVDDGSSDGGETICDEYGKKDDRIRVFHQENRGLSSALNLGLDMACGEYIAMVDSDDVLLSRDYLNILYNAIKEHDADVSVCRINTFHNDSTVPKPEHSFDDRTLLTGKDVFTKKPYSLNVGIFSVSVSKLYRKSLFTGVRYPLGRIMEDLSIFHYLVYPCSRIVLLEDRMYGRRIRSGSITTGCKGSIQYIDTLAAIDDCIEYLKDKGDKTAVSYASQRKTAHVCYYYLHALKDGTLDELPVEIRPSITDFESMFSILLLLRTLRKADPDFSDYHTKEYLSILSTRALDLLRISCDYLLRKRIRRNCTKSEAIPLRKLAVSENLSAMFHAALGIMDDDDTIKTTRKYILMQHEQKRMIEECFTDDIPVIIPFIPSKLVSLYAKPWLRWSEPTSFLTDRYSTDLLVSKMKARGFDPLPIDPLEKDRSRSISFESSDDVRFKFLFGPPFILYGACGDYLTELFSQLVQERREMTLTEYTTMLVIKLQTPNMYPSSACLCDLLDLTVIMDAYPELTEDIGFCDLLKKLDLETSWKSMRSICEKVLMTSESEISLHEDENEFLCALISRPFLRASFLEKTAESMMKNDWILDPIEYTVLREKNLAYLVNSKVACSSIKASMIDGDVPDDYSIHKVADQQGLSRMELKGDEEDYYCFTFVRNPFARLVSCYESKYHVDRDRFGRDDYFRNYLDGYLHHDNGFDEFIRKICALPYRLMDRHFKPQYDLVYDVDGECRCDYIGRFEIIDEDFSPLQKKYCLRPLPHFNRIGTDNWMDYYTPETAALVYETFQKDVEEFGYADTYLTLSQKKSP